MAEPSPLLERPLVRAGVFAWAIIGIGVVIIGAANVLTVLRVVSIPLFLALFPAALLWPLVAWLRSRGTPRAIATIVAMVGSIAVVAGLVSLLAPQVAAELPPLAESLRQGTEDFRGFLEETPLVTDPSVIDDAIEQGRDFFQSWLREGGIGLAVAVLEGIVGLLFGIVALFFYLKDGDRIAAWGSELVPARLRADAEAIATRAWLTLGAYFRGQLLVALVDAVFIGLGLVLLRVPLALPLAVLVFFGGLFPIAGAFASGAVAVLVALAHGGPLLALAVFALVLAVQQLESNILAPVVLGKATRLHPLAVLVALTAGGVVLGVLGAFIAVPIAASVARGFGHVRDRPPPLTPTPDPTPDPLM